MAVDKFYDLVGSPNTRRVRIFMAEKGVQFPTVKVDMAKGENRMPDFLAKNSLGGLPVLEIDDGTSISESMAICRYLEQQYPEPPLFGCDEREQITVEMWNRRMEFEILLPVISIFVNTHEMWRGRRRQVPEWADCCREQVSESYNWLNSELEGRAFIATTDYTVADITAQAAVLMAKAVCGVRIQDSQVNLAAWWERVASRPTARA